MQSDRREFVFGGAALALALAIPQCARAQDTAFAARLGALERDTQCRIGVAAIDAGNGRVLGHRADERFALCSTFKVMLVAAILARAAAEPALLDRRIAYAQGDLVTYSPITEKHIADGMTVSELCAAGLQYSDNTAANLLLGLVGGPEVLTRFARAGGDAAFRLDRWETELNSAIPGDARDTTTPGAMAQSLQRLLLGDGMPEAMRKKLEDWMRGNTTGATRIRAGVPEGWVVADKTGSGDYGAANDVGLLRPPGRAPLLIAIYTSQVQKDAKPNSEAVAGAAKIVAEMLAG